MKIIHCNLLSIQRGILVHQVNLQGKMGAGLAKQLRDRYPIVYQKYREHLANFTLGNVQFIKVSDAPLYVCNLAGQQNYGRGKQHTDYDAVAIALQKIREVSDRLSLPAYLPYGMSCGLAGGDWQIVSALISEHCPEAVICKL